jgi:DNA-binding Lrp family transcriptional regulator
MQAAFVLIQVAGPGRAGDFPSMHDKLHAVPGVKTVHFVAGPNDVIVFVEAADHAALMDSISQIRTVEGVDSTDTRIVLPI